MDIYEYFKDYELDCSCGCGLMPDNRSIEMLYAFRILYNKPVKVNSGARCKVYNKMLNGSVGSAHLIGAFDIKVPLEDEWECIRIAQFVGFTGIGFDDNRMLHLDRHHKRPAFWGYK